LQVYERRLREAVRDTGLGRLRVLSYAILDTHGNRYPKYWLVHSTHAATGVTTFAEECEKTDRTQSAIFHAANVIRRETKTGVTDLFRDVGVFSGKQDSPSVPETGSWLTLLPSVGDCVSIDTERWADLLEQGRCLSIDLQEGFKELRDNGILENLDAKRKRRKRFVHYENNERIRRLS
jgi:hypothetical protein